MKLLKSLRQMNRIIHPLELERYVRQLAIWCDSNLLYASPRAVVCVCVRIKIHWLCRNIKDNRVALG